MTIECRKAYRKIARNVRFKRKKWTVEFPLMELNNLDEIEIELKEMVKNIQQILKDTKNGELYDIELTVETIGHVWWYPIFKGVRKKL